MRKLYNLSRIVLFLPNLFFSVTALLFKLAASYDDQANFGLVGDVFFIAGVAVLAATVGRLLSGKRSLLVPIAWMGPLCVCAIGVLLLAEAGAGKGAILGLGLILGAVLAALVCMKLSKFLAWAAFKADGRFGGAAASNADSDS